MNTQQTRKPSSHMRTSPRGQGQKLTKEETQETQKKFLRAFSETANVRSACIDAGIDRSTIRKWEEHDEHFSFRYKLAKDEADDIVRAEIRRRAVEGYERPRVSCGKLVYDEEGNLVTETVYSDNLLALLAKARLPEFRESPSVDTIQIENVNVLTIDTRSLSPDQLIALKSLAMNMKQEVQG